MSGRRETAVLKKEDSRLAVSKGGGGDGRRARTAELRWREPLLKTANYFPNLRGTRARRRGKCRTKVTEGDECGERRLEKGRKR